MIVPSTRVQYIAHDDVTSEIGVIVDVDTEVVLGQRTTRSTKPERFRCTTLNPAGGL